MTEKIIGTGSALPQRIVSNEELAKIVDTSDEWIRSRTGIMQRHLTEQETTADLAALAAKRAVEDAGIDAAEIDLIIATTGTAEHLYPCIACEVQKELKAENAGCFDVSAACTGFLTAYQISSGMLRTGQAKHILIVSSEVMSNVINWEDRSSCILFGDGAAAVVITSDDAAEDDPEFLLKADGARGGALSCRTGIGKNNKTEPEKLQMDGSAIYKFAVRNVPETVHTLLDRRGMTADEIDYFILHQANRRIITSVAEKLGAPMEKFPVNLDRCANTSSASIPLLLDELNKTGKLQRGMKLILAGFGAGLTWGGALINW